MTASGRVVWHGREVKGRIADALAGTLADGAGFILEEANRTVPIEEGTLSRSGNTDTAGLEASVYYDTPYAARQHEEVTWNHAPGRRAKWLQLTFAEQARRLDRFIRDRVAKAFR